MLGTRLILALGIAVSLLGWGFNPGRASETESWRFLTEVQVTGDYITLADLADSIPKPAQNYGSLIIWSAPPCGEVYTLTREFLGYCLSKPKVLGKAFLPHLPPVIKVKRPGVRVEMEQLTEVFRRHVEDHSSWPAKSLEVQVMPITEPIILPPGKLTFQVIPPPRCNYLGQVTLELLILRDAQVEKKLRLTGEVSVTRPVVCTSHSLRSKKVIMPEDIKVVERKFSQLAHNAIFMDPAQVIGKAVVRDLGPGAVISPKDLLYTPLIKQGDLVTIRLEQGGLVLTAKGKARESGDRGQSIRVINCASKKELQALVIDQSTVKVVL
ncbi:MAG: flagella basal body P-ring formation protein FlgA [Desulfobacca sp. 4484_104]|nr:MAG: flagella basal body P-ring formation protein FlgA [Desulfobacca sp. 4484_104]RLA89586.1 MAG: flagella basal body P-ring formation protein FlgA [Deltaproteobacteria bacterium]